MMPCLDEKGNKTLKVINRNERRRRRLDNGRAIIKWNERKYDDFVETGI